MTGRPPAPALAFASWILWQDDHLVAVDKPAGVLSQGGEGGAGINLVDLARKHLGVPGVGVLHRLDRNVSGVVLLAKTPRAARGLGIQIREGAVERVYRAVVRGAPAREVLCIEAPLRKDEARNQVVALDPDAWARLAPVARGAYKPARTDVTVLSRFVALIGPCAELEVRPFTGRSHQIRAHLAHIGLPILGDPKYGVPARGIARPLLHAKHVAFRHPITGERIEIEAPIPWSAVMLQRLARG